MVQKLVVKKYTMRVIVDQKKIVVQMDERQVIRKMVQMHIHGIVQMRHDVL